MKLFTAAMLATASALAPRRVIIDGQNFVDATTKEKILLTGPNVVVKGPPYLPSVEGDSICVDNVDGDCVADASCSSCTTFNQADVDHIIAQGHNTIRLSIVWAGAQTEEGNELSAYKKKSQYYYV